MSTRGSRNGLWSAPVKPGSNEAPLFRSLDANELSVDTAWWKIYRDSFPSDEREHEEIILHSLQQGVGLAIAARSGGETIGLATTHLLKDPAAVFLVYLAISREWRRHGLGGSLLEHTWQTSSEKLLEFGLFANGLIWEVEGPDQSSDTADLHSRESRIAFFRRHGGELLPRPYFQPPVNGGAPVAMRLMYRAAAGTVQPAASNIERLVQAIYFEKYGAVNRIPSFILARLLDSGREQPLQGNN